MYSEPVMKNKHARNQAPKSLYVIEVMWIDGIILLRLREGYILNFNILKV